MKHPRETKPAPKASPPPPTPPASAFHMPGAQIGQANFINGPAEFTIHSQTINLPPAQKTPPAKPSRPSASQPPAPAAPQPKPAAPPTNLPPTPPPPQSFDVFLSHNSQDKPAVLDLKRRLVARKLTVWFDADELQPGIPWQKLLEDGIKASKSVAVVIGKDGLGPWEDEEMQGALRLAVKDKRPVIPVLLPGASAQPELPMFLGNRTWVDLRAGFTKPGLDRLQWGITGQKPPTAAASAASLSPTAGQGATAPESESPSAAVGPADGSHRKPQVGSSVPHGDQPVGLASTSPGLADISRILKYAPAELIGREAQTKLLHDAWSGNWQPEIGNRQCARPRILTFVALGGEGKTSLVAKWAAELAAQDWPGCDAAFAWSFYSQGTREQLAASSDLFLKEALTFFAELEPEKQRDETKAFAASPAGAFEKGQRLARLVGQRRSLLILDGLEPLQYAPTAPTPGELKDQGVAALLRALAAASHSLCVVTTRYSLPDLKAFWQTTAPEVKLLRLSRDAGVHLLKTLGVRGTAQEFTTLVEDVKGHALTLTLLGGFLKRAFHGDIRQRDRVKFEKADEKMDGGHAFRTMAAYEQWLLRDGGDEGRREVAVLRLMGLFDRPADAGCLAALRSETIPGLTEPLAGLADDDWEYCLSGLETAKLLTVNRDAAGALVSLDAHPHLREYFARQLRTQQPDAWRAAHRRLYEHLCATTPDKPQPTLEDLQPLYQAVAHGCQAGLQQEVVHKVYDGRLLRREEKYSKRKLGAVASDLGAAACFFETAWSHVSPALSEDYKPWLLNDVAYSLRALGRLTEALEPMRAGLENYVKQENWHYAAITASNLSELELTLGEVAGAVGDAEQSVTYADRSGDEFRRVVSRCAFADALHQAGRRAEAETRFREAEQMQQERQPAYPLMYSLEGFRDCDLLLAAPERAAWQRTLECGDLSPLCAGDLSPSKSAARPQLGEPLKLGSALPTSRQSAKSGDESPHSKALRAVSQRAAQTLDWCTTKFVNASLLDIALDHLTLGRAALYAAILESCRSRREEAQTSSPENQRLLTSSPTIETARRELDAAVAGLRRAGAQEFIVRGLLTRAWLRFLTGARTGPESAQADLDEAWEIAERGPMKLFLADIHLHRARLFRARNEAKTAEEYPWESPAADLAAARRLIEQCGYGRRKEELEDAKKGIVT